MGSTQPRRLYLITCPRTASHLLLRILSLEDQPNVWCPGSFHGYFFFPYFSVTRTLKVHERPTSAWTSDEKTQVQECLRGCFEKFKNFLQNPEGQNKIVLVKEHSEFLVDQLAESRFFSGGKGQGFSFKDEMPNLSGGERTWSPMNDTFLPDEFLASWLPTFLIRHPALALPSHYRSFRNVQTLRGNEVYFPYPLTNHWTRSLYDLYTEKLLKSNTEPGADDNSIWPIILDADDVMSSPAVIRKYCQLVGLDPEKLKFNWSADTGSETAKVVNPLPTIMMDTLRNSTGIMPGKTSTGIDINVEANKWREEFGEEVGIKLEKWVRDSMSDYEFLKARRLRA